MKYHEFDPYTKKEIVGYYEEAPKKIPVMDNVDILVVGGSQSGVAAAVAASRHGMRVQIVERFGFLGGQSVFGNVVQWEKRAFINNLGAVLTKGIPKEMLDRIVAKGDSDGLWNTPPGCPEMRDGEEWLNPEAIKSTLFEMCMEESIEILLHTLAVDVITEIDGDRTILKGVIFENKTGRFAIKAKKIIDATADLDLVWKAIGEKGCNLRAPAQRILAGFYIWYGGVDNETYIDWYLKNTKTEEGYPNPIKYPDKVRKHLKENKLIIVHPNNFNVIMEKADEMDLFEKFEDILLKFNLGLAFKLGMKRVGHDRWSLSLTGMKVNTGDAWDITQKEIVRQLLAFYLLPILKLIPGWENCYISRENISLGLREFRTLKAIRLIDQDYIWNPIHESEATPDDAVGRSGAHDPGKNFLRAGYPIPYGILVPEKIDGVIACARSVGTKFDRALSAHRGITPSAVTGQAAGTAAALAMKANVKFRDLDVVNLQETLRKDGVQLDHESVTFNFKIPKDKIKKIPK